MSLRSHSNDFVANHTLYRDAVIILSNPTYRLRISEVRLEYEIKTRSSYIIFHTQVPSHLRLLSLSPSTATCKAAFIRSTSILSCQ